MRSPLPANVQQLPVGYRARVWVASPGVLADRALPYAGATGLRRLLALSTVWRGIRRNRNRRLPEENFLCVRSDIELQIMLAELHYPPTRSAQSARGTQGHESPLAIVR